MYKLRSMGISGKFFSCLKFMYNNSQTRIKLIQKLSKTIDVTIGTEQGHPLSPELFKMFVHDLSIKLSEIDHDTSVPLLNDFPVSHLPVVQIPGGMRGIYTPQYFLPIPPKKSSNFKFGPHLSQKDGEYRLSG